MDRRTQFEKLMLKQYRGDQTLIRILSRSAELQKESPDYSDLIKKEALKALLQNSGGKDHMTNFENERKEIETAKLAISERMERWKSEIETAEAELAEVAKKMSDALDADNETEHGALQNREAYLKDRIKSRSENIKKAELAPAIDAIQYSEIVSAITKEFENEREKSVKAVISNLKKAVFEADHLAEIRQEANQLLHEAQIDLRKEQPKLYSGRDIQKINISDIETWINNICQSTMFRKYIGDLRPTKERKLDSAISNAISNTKIY